MVRISDARMSGTAYGTVVLHVAPESAVGGPLAAVRDGDEIELDVPDRRLTLHVAEDEIARRLASQTRPKPTELTRRGHGWLYVNHVSRRIRASISIFCAADWGGNDRQQHSPAASTARGSSTNLFALDRTGWLLHHDHVFVEDDRERGQSRALLVFLQVRFLDVHLRPDYRAECTRRSSGPVLRPA